MGLGGFFKGLGKGIVKGAKYAAGPALLATGVGAPFAGMATAGLGMLDKKLSQPKQPQMGRGMSPSFDFAKQRFPSMQGTGRGASPQMNMDDYISAGRNTVNPNWMMPAFNPNQPHPMSRMPPYGNAPMRPQGMPPQGGGMQMGGGNPLMNFMRMKQGMQQGGLRPQVQPTRMPPQ
jgi:hypothetical protein